MTPEECSKLTNEELRNRMARLEGWSQTRIDRLGLSAIPDYPCDLNVTHRAELAHIVPISSRDIAFSNYLFRIAGHTSNVGMLHATARQRAEAFVLAMGCHG